MCPCLVDEASWLLPPSRKSSHESPVISAQGYLPYRSLRPCKCPHLRAFSDLRPVHTAHWCSCGRAQAGRGLGRSALTRSDSMRKAASRSICGFVNKKDAGSWKRLWVCANTKSRKEKPDAENGQQRVVWLRVQPSARFTCAEMKPRWRPSRVAGGGGSERRTAGAERGRSGQQRSARRWGRGDRLCPLGSGSPSPALKGSSRRGAGERGLGLGPACVTGVGGRTERDSAACVRPHTCAGQL